MKKPLTYALSVVIALLLVFSYLGAVAGGILKFRALSSGTALKIAESEQLAQKVHDTLEAYYVQQENVTGIPADTYADAINAEALTPIIRELIADGFGYVNGTVSEVAVSPDFSALENNMTAFFVRYAEENGYERDGLFDEKLSAAIETAEENILTACDVFRFRTLADAGYLKKLRLAAPWANYLLIGSLAAILLLLVILGVLYRKEKPMLLYWLGTSVLVGSVLMLIPAVWLTATRWFDRFAVKEDQIFTAVTGYLYSLTGTAITAAIIGIVLAAVLYVMLGIVSRAHPKST